MTVLLAARIRSEGGVWRHIRDLSQGLVDAGVETSLLLPTDAYRLRALAADRGVSCSEVSEMRGHDVLHVHLADTYDRASLQLMARARMLGLRVVVTEHLPRTDASDPKIALRDPRFGAQAAKTGFKTLQYALCDQVIALSEGSADFLRTRYGLSPSKTSIVRNAIRRDPEPSGASADGDASATHRLRLIAAGALIHQKGFDLLVAAAEQASGYWGVDVYGTGPHEARLTQLASRSKVRDIRPIQFKGWSANVTHEMQSADGVVVPSRWEAFPYVALEAMAQGKALVATAVDGLSEIVDPHVSGLLVSPEDPGALGAALDALATDRQNCRQMGEAGRRRVDRSFPFHAMMAGTLEAYRLASRPRRGDE